MIDLMKDELGFWIVVINCFDKINSLMKVMFEELIEVVFVV